MIEKRFTWLKKDGYAPQIVITDSLTEKDLTPTDCYELLNELADENEQLRQSEDNLYTFFIQWFEEERGINQEEFCEWWNAIQKGKTKFNGWEEDNND